MQYLDDDGSVISWLRHRTCNSVIVSTIPAAELSVGQYWDG